MSFHVPNRWRLRSGPLASTTRDGDCGAFLVASCEHGWHLLLIADDGRDITVPDSLDWEHVSVSARRAGSDQTRLPTWREMCQVKDLCWDPEDVVMQLHPRRSQYVNQHPHVLHLWRSRAQPIPEPPAHLVGVLPS